MKSISSEYIRVGRSEVSDDTLNGFVVYDDETVRRRIAENPKCSKEILERLSRDEARSVRTAVAANANTDARVLLSLASDRDPDLRYSMAENHNLPFQILDLLTHDENPYVQARALSTLSRKQTN